MRIFSNLMFFAVLSSLHLNAQSIAKAKQKLSPVSIYDISTFGNPIVSPEGDWVLFSVAKADAKKDKQVAKLYMINKEGTETLTLTEQTKGVSNYNWSPDGKYISYLTTGKEEEEDNQLYLMDRRGGEPIQITHIKGEISNYQWFKDASKVLFEIKDPSYLVHRYNSHLDWFKKYLN